MTQKTQVMRKAIRVFRSLRMLVEAPTLAVQLWGMLGRAFWFGGVPATTAQAEILEARRREGAK